MTPPEREYGAADYVVCARCGHWAVGHGGQTYAGILPCYCCAHVEPSWKWDPRYGGGEIRTPADASGSQTTAVPIADNATPDARGAGGVS